MSINITSKKLGPIKKGFKLVSSQIRLLLILSILFYTGCKNDDDSIVENKDPLLGVKITADESILEAARKVTRKIALVVNTDSFVNSELELEDRITEFTWLNEENNPRADKICLKKYFTVEVNPANRIEWSISKSENSSNRYDIEFINIKMKENVDGNTNFFDGKTLVTNGSGKKISAKIKEVIDGFFYYEYNINFKIIDTYDSDNRIEPVTIDPKLKMNVSKLVPHY